MPTYEYECTECGHNFEAFQSMKDEPLRSCPSCGKSVRRVVSGGAGVIFKGSGFYNTDKAAKEKKEAAPCGAAKEAKPACANCPAAGAA
jgi:putative FmdB family regulatory protein